MIENIEKLIEKGVEEKSVVEYYTYLVQGKLYKHLHEDPLSLMAFMSKFEDTGKWMEEKFPESTSVIDKLELTLLKEMTKIMVCGADCESYSVRMKAFYYKHKAKRLFAELTDDMERRTDLINKFKKESPTQVFGALIASTKTDKGIEVKSIGKMIKKLRKELEEINETQ